MKKWHLISVILFAVLLIGFAVCQPRDPDLSKVRLNMTENQPQSSLVQERQKNISLITAGIFTLLGLTFFIYEIYSIIGPQKGHFDFSESKSCCQWWRLMFLVAIASLLLI